MKLRKSSWLTQRALGCLAWVAVFSLAACKQKQLAPDTPVAEELRPSWSSEAYARQRTDQAWHFAYAVQSWAAEQTGHLVLIPARNNIVVDKSYFGDELSHLPGKLLPGAKPKDPEQIVILKHQWAAHGTSWDYDTDIKLVLYGPGFVKQGIRLDKTTLQNIAPTYAQLIGTEPPKGSMGKSMTEVLVKSAQRPMVILTVVIDGGGRALFRTWPDAWPNIKGLAARGVEYLDAKVTQLETATAPSHAAIGTGGSPFTTRLLGNDIYDLSNRRVVGAFADFTAEFIRTSTLADEYSVKTSHRGVVIGASFSAHPAIGMVGHGAGFDPQNKSHIVVFFGKPKKAAWKQQFPGAEGDNRVMTNIDLFSFPEYLRGRTPTPYIHELTGGTGIWLDHKIADASIVHYSPAGVRFECDNMLMMMERERIDQTDVTALIYMNFKGADLSAHRWGLESIETRDNLREEDACIGRLVEKLNQRVGEDNYVLTITADHGMAPLPELVNGHRILLARLLELIDTKFGGPISLGGGLVNLWFDQSQLEQRGLTHRDVAGYVASLSAGEYYGPRERWPTYLDYRPEEKLFFAVYTAEQLAAYVSVHPTDWMANPYAH